MKKLATLLSSLLIITGLKAQTVPVKKETVKPKVIKPVVTADSIKSGKMDTAYKQTSKPIKMTKPDKQIVMPIKNTNPVAKPGKF